MQCVHSYITKVSKRELQKYTADMPLAKIIHNIKYLVLYGYERALQQPVFINHTKFCKWHTTYTKYYNNLHWSRNRGVRSCAWLVKVRRWHPRPFFHTYTLCLLIFPRSCCWNGRDFILFNVVVMRSKDTIHFNTIIYDKILSQNYT